MTHERTKNPKVFGHIEGIPVGRTFATRQECSREAVHAPLRRGISGVVAEGAYSVVLSGGYEDIDKGDVIIYTGSGGKSKYGSKMDQMLGKERWDGPQSSDQVWSGDNEALRLNSQTGKPVRVIRGSTLESHYAPFNGYRYDGLYTVEDAWEETDKHGFKMCKFRFRRIPGQPSLPNAHPIIKTTRIKKIQRRPNTAALPMTHKNRRPANLPRPMPDPTPLAQRTNRHAESFGYPRRILRLPRQRINRKPGS